MRQPKIKPLAIALAMVISPHYFAAEADSDANQVAADSNSNSEEVMVIVRKREENVMDIPIAMSVFSVEDMQDGGITDISDIASLTPGFTFAPLFGGGASTPVIRGLSTTIGEANVGFFIDGIYQSSRELMESQIGNNIERIEVAKGPQSALYGRNTFGGAINFVTRAPSEDYEGELMLGAGDYGKQALSLTHSGPVGDAYYRLWINHTSRDGYYTNELTGGDIDERETNTFGLKLSSGTEDDFYWALTLGVANAADGGEALQQIENTGDFFAPLNDFQLYDGEVPSITEGYAATPGHDDRDTVSGSLNLSWDLGNLILTSISGYNTFEGNNYSDDDYTAREIHETSTVKDKTEVSQEIRLQSDNDSQIEWTIGAYYYDLDLDTDVYSEFIGNYFFFGGLNANTNQTTQSTAIYGSVNYELNDNWNLIFSGRYFDEEKTATATDTNLGSGAVAVFTDTADFSDFTPRFDVEYHMDNGGLIYASAAKAIKAGGFNVVTAAGAILPEERTYDEETSMNYELGYKQSFVNNTVNFTADIFQIKWEDQIVRALGATNAVLNENAGETTSQGFEMEINARPTESLTVRAGLAYTDSSYDDYFFGALAGLGMDPVLDGTQLQYVSEWQGNLTLQYRGGNVFEDFNWFARFDASYQSEQSLIQNAHATVGARTISNLRLGIENVDWRVYVWADNAFDDDTAITGVFIPGWEARVDFFTGQRPGFQVFQGLINAPNPRTVGITAYYNF